MEFLKKTMVPRVFGAILLGKRNKKIKKDSLSGHLKWAEKGKGKLGVDREISGMKRGDKGNKVSGAKNLGDDIRPGWKDGVLSGKNTKVMGLRKEGNNFGRVSEIKRKLSEMGPILVINLASEHIIQGERLPSLNVRKKIKY